MIQTKISVNKQKRNRLQFSDSEEQSGDDAEGALESASEAEVETELTTSPAKRQKLQHSKDVLIMKISHFSNFVDSEVNDVQGHQMHPIAQGWLKSFLSDCFIC